MQQLTVGGRPARATDGAPWACSLSVPKDPFPDRGLTMGPWGPAGWCLSETPSSSSDRKGASRGSFSRLLKAGPSWDLWGSTAHRRLTCKAKLQAAGTFRPPGRESVPAEQGRKPEGGCGSCQARQNPLSHLDPSAHPPTPPPPPAHTPSLEYGCQWAPARPP